MTATPNAPFRHVYHLNRTRLLIFPVMWGIAVVLTIVAVANEETLTLDTIQTLLIVIGAITLFMLPFFGLMWQSRLVLTAEGIAHHQFGYTIRSAWEDLATLDMRKGVENLVLAKPGTGSVRLLSGSATILNAMGPGSTSGLVGNTRAYSEGRLITLAPFMSHWTRGPLRDDLLRCAPYLFDGAGQPVG